MSAISPEPNRQQRHNTESQPEMPKLTLSGVIELRPYAVGSKSESVRAFFVTAEGEFLFRPKGANAFSDKAVNELAGKEIEATGVVRGPLFIADSYKSV